MGLWIPGKAAPERAGQGGAGVSKADAFSGRVARTPRVCSDGSPGALKVMGITVAK